MTSHREAPSISKDPVADNTDLYAFVSPDKPNTVTILANYIPLEEPAGGPNFNSFGDDVLYEIKIDNDADAKPDITYQFTFRTTVANKNTFLYNTGPIATLDSPNWNVRQFYKVTEVKGDGIAKVLGDNLPCPPVNIGPRSTPSYASLADAAIKALSDGSSVFAGARADGFYVDLGSIFDLGTLRPLESYHLIPVPPNAAGVNGLKGYNCHSIALQVPISKLTSDGSVPTDPSKQEAVLGFWATASRRAVRVPDGASSSQAFEEAGPFVQVSRLGNPLINEVVIPVGTKDQWNTVQPSMDSAFAPYYLVPELSKLLPVLYPGVFPNLAGLSGSAAPRNDLAAILLTGIPSGIITGFQNFTGATQADMLRLNVAIPPNTTAGANPPFNSSSRQGILGGDLAGYPNGRRVFDNVVAIELRAIAGLTYPLVMPSYTPDAAAGILADTDTPDPGVTKFSDAQNDVTNAPYLGSFPYLATPYQGYEHEHDP